MKIGTITQVSGPVVDVAFEAGHLPRIKEALTVELNGQTNFLVKIRSQPVSADPGSWIPSQVP